MGRNLIPLFTDPVSHVQFARFYDEKGKICRLSCNTTDKAEAMKRFPIIQKTKMSWNQYQKSLSGMNTMVVNAISDHKITPPLTYKVDQSSLTKMIEQSLQTGTGFYDSRNYFIFTGLPGGVQTDSTAMPNYFPTGNNGNGLFHGVDTLKTSAIIDNRQEIDKFFKVTVLQCFQDKKRIRCVFSIWLDYLDKNDIKSWVQITEDLMILYKNYRKTTPIPRGKNFKVGGTLPGASTVNREFLHVFRKAFDEAIARGFMKINPIRNWVPDPETSPPPKILTLPELKKVFDRLTGVIRDICVLLYASCKRRKEIMNLRIEDVNFDDHYAGYYEFKNASRIEFAYKAFWLTPAMERFLKRIIGDRTNGPLWLEICHATTVSHTFKDIVFQIAPSKNIELKKMRQIATDCMEKAGLTDPEIDAALGHGVVSKVLEHYKTRSVEAIYRRLSKNSQKGIEVVSSCIEEYLI